MARLTILLMGLFFVPKIVAFTQKSECLLPNQHVRRGEDEFEENEGKYRGRVDEEGYRGRGDEEGYRGRGDEEGYRGRGDEEGYRGRVDEELEAGGGYGGQARYNSEEEKEDTGRRSLGHPPYWHRDNMPNKRPSGRYLDEEGEWEDDRRKKRRKRGDKEREREYKTPYTHEVLVGQLSCVAGSIMHVLNVTVGYTNSRQCYQESPGCQAGSAQAKQIIHCQGNTGVCYITIERHFMIRCGHQANFALVYYECIPEAKLVDICSHTNLDIVEAMALTSPNYPRRSLMQTAGSSTDIVTCECTLRAPEGSRLELEYVRTHLPVTGSTCDGDLLVLERPDPVLDGRYLMEREMCGHNVSNNVMTGGKTLRVSFLTGAPVSEGKSGFLAKFKALSAEGNNEIFHVSCGGQDSLVKQATGRPGQPTEKSSNLLSNLLGTSLLEWMRSQGRTPPPNFDPHNLPANFLNMTREELQSKLQQYRAQSQKIVGTRIGEPNHNPDPSSSDNTSSGVLTGVVASLASVILILGSVGTFIFYRRYQKKKAKQDHHHYQEEEEITSIDYGSWYESEFASSTSGSSSRGCNSLVSVNNRRRPLPDPHRDLRDPAGPPCSSADPGAGLESTTRVPLSKMIKAGENESGTESYYVNNAYLPGVYSVAVNIPFSTEKSQDTVGEHSRSQSQMPLPAIEAQPPISQNSCQSTNPPVAPARTKRKKTIHKMENNNNYLNLLEKTSSKSSPAVPEADNISIGDRTTSKISGHPITTSRSSSHNNEDEGYSYIDEIQVESQI